VPIIPAIKDCKRLGEVEIEELERRQRPCFEVNTVSQKGHQQNHGSMKRRLVGFRILRVIRTYPQTIISRRNMYMSAPEADLRGPSQLTGELLAKTYKAKGAQIIEFVGRKTHANAARIRQALKLVTFSFNSLRECGRRK
jgi:hypothetical protein